MELSKPHMAHFPFFKQLHVKPEKRLDSSKSEINLHRQKDPNGNVMTICGRNYFSSRRKVKGSILNDRMNSIDGGEQKGCVKVPFGSVRTQARFTKSKNILHKEEC